MARSKKEITENTPPKWKVGDRVTVEFIVSKYVATITELKKNPHNTKKWIYTAVTDDGMTIPYIGTDWSEKFANICE
jgi:hypothetical protein